MVLNRPDWIDDAQFADAAARVRHVEARKTETAAEIAKWPMQALLERLRDVDVPSAPLLTRQDLIEDAQVEVNNLLVVEDFGALGRVRQPRPVADFDLTPSGIQGAAPYLGEHVRAILHGLGYDADRIADLESRGVVGVSSPPPGAGG